MAKTCVDALQLERKVPILDTRVEETPVSLLRARLYASTGSLGPVRLPGWAQFDRVREADILVTLPKEVNNQIRAAGDAPLKALGSPREASHKASPAFSIAKPKTFRRDSVVDELSKR